jgi:hypothetical protein
VTGDANGGHFSFDRNSGTSVNVALPLFLERAVHRSKRARSV